MPPQMSKVTVVPSTSTLLRAAAAPARCTNPIVSRVPQSSAGFSTTASRPYMTLHRREFVKWLKKEAVRYKHPAKNNWIEPNQGRGEVIEDAPFPLNKEFRVYPRLSERSCEIIWNEVIKQGRTIKEVSAKYGVDINRVGAVVRLKEVEKDWIAKGKPLATPYSDAIRGMSSESDINDGGRQIEPINEVHVHSHTMKQIFWPTSESRQFTREDAAAAFHKRMLSTDKRVPHPELVQMERDILGGKSPKEAALAFRQATKDAEEAAVQRKAAKAQAEDRVVTRIPTVRAEFRFREVDSERVGPKGRNKNAVGERYGRPSYDRVKGLVRHPTSVP